MSNPFAPNKNGVVVVTLAQPYGSNVAGEKAGFLPEIAKALVKKGMAVLPGQTAPQADAGAQGGPEMTSRKFTPQRDPLDHDSDGKKGGSLPDDQRVLPGSATDSLRAEFKELTGKDADSRWGAARLAAEIEKALEAATAPADGEAEAPQADAGA
jgi:hypothetical protein